MTSDNRVALKDQISSSQVFIDSLHAAFRDHNYLPAAGSPISLDKAQSHHSELEWSGELYEQSDVQAQMSLLAAVQNLSLAIEDAGYRPAAFIVLLRGSIEAAASANFLSPANTVSVAERARRGLNEMLNGAFGQWRALDQYGESADAAAKLAVMNKWLVKAANYAELGHITRAHEGNKSRAAPYVGDKRPTISAMIDALFPTPDNRRFGRWLYSALSAPAHSAAHGFAIAGAQKLLPDGTQTVDQEAELSHDRVARFAITAISAVDTAANSVFTRYGWPLADLEDKLKDAYSSWLSVVGQ